MTIQRRTIGTVARRTLATSDTLVKRQKFKYCTSTPSVFFDIETVPTEDAELIQDIADNIKPPGNYKKEESIAEWIKNEKPALVQEAIHKTGLDAAYGRICSIAMAFNDQSVISHAATNEKEVVQWCFEMIKEFGTAKIHGGETGGNGVTMIGHSLRQFDLRFVWQRAAVLALKRPHQIAWNVPHWDPRVQDTQEIWDPSGRNRIKLSVLCKILGIPSPKRDGMDGAKVWDAYKKGEISRIQLYNEDDVEATRAVWWRLTNPDMSF